MSAAEHSDAHTDSHGHDDHAHNYVRIWGILVALLVISVIGPFVGDATGVRAITLLTAFGIAVYKAYLVVKNFMHLPAERAFVTYMVVTCLVFMFLFFAGTAPDVMKNEGAGWEKPLWQQQEAAWLASQAAGAHDAGHAAPDGASHGGSHDGDPSASHGEADH